MADIKEKWQGRLALSTALMAVLAAVTTLYMGKYSSRAILLQGQESNQWAYYQAKSIKQHTFELQKERLELELLSQGGKMPEPVAKGFTAAVGQYGKEVNRYDGEKKEIKQKADLLTAGKDKAQGMAGNFGYSLIFLQIAIMLSSIASLTGRKYLWYIGLGSVTGWIAFFVNAFVLLF